MEINTAPVTLCCLSLKNLQDPGAFFIKVLHVPTIVLVVYSKVGVFTSLLKFETLVSEIKQCLE